MERIDNIKDVACFKYDETASQPGKYIIRPVHENFFLESTEGSFNVICARVFNISYADYLRMCRDCYEAEIIGKNIKYPVAYFKSTKSAQALVNELNKRANVILRKRRALLEE